MPNTLLARCARAAFLLALVLCAPRCAKKLGSSSEVPADDAAEDTSFSTLTTSITNGSASDYSVFSATDASGNIYLSGTANNSWVMLKSTDGGSNWNQEFSVGAGSAGYQVAADSLGNVFAVGSSGGSPSSGTIKKYGSVSGTWSTAYSAQIQSGSLTILHGVAVDSHDWIFAVGEGKSTLVSPDGFPDMAVTKLIVLKSTDHGGTWTLVDSFAIDDYSWTSGTGILVASSGDLYAYGNAQASSRSQTVIRRSTDGGASWTRVNDDFGSIPRGLVEWNGGLVLSEDYYHGTSSSTASRVRASTDTFGHMKILDTYAPTGATSLLTGELKKDSANRLYYPMQYYAADGSSHLVLRATTTQGGWETIDDYSVPSGESLYVSNLFIDKDFHVYTVAAHNAGATTKWIIRKGKVSSTGTTTFPDMSNGTDLVSPVPAGAKRLFVTSRTHNGLWGGSAAAAITNADAFCNSDPSKPLVTSATYKALLVNASRKACTSVNCGGGAGENLDWVFAASKNYVTREGVALGATDASGIFTAFSRALLTNIVDHAWTGLETTNREWTVDTNQCNDWRSNDGFSYSGSAWVPRGADLGDIYAQNDTQTCDTLLRLICVEQ